MAVAILSPEKAISRKGKLLINGEFVDALSGKEFETLNPSTGEVLAHVAEADKADVDRAVKAARTAFEEGPWSRMNARERGRLLLRLTQLVADHADELALIDTLDNGKPIRETTHVDVPLVIDCLGYYAGWADKIEGETIPVNGPFLNYTLKEPVGVVGQIIPWNFPLLMAAWKLGPALATGCTVVLKPAEQTPLSALRLGELILEAGFPEGVVNILPGFGPTAGAAIASHLDVDKVAFTGSTEVGRLIMEMAAKSNLKRVTLELGGKAPNIVMSDAIIDEAVKGAVTGIFLNQGEVCCAGSRLFVEDKVHDEVVSKLKAYAEGIKVGNPLDPATEMGAQVSEEQLDRILNYCQSGKAEGATVVTGGGRNTAAGKGYFMHPTIFSDVKDSMKIAREEIFGPVVSAIRFSEIGEAVQRGNRTNYGLSAAVWTRDIKKAHTIARKLRAGVVWINTYNTFDAASPFGGYKESGIGRELGKHALANYLETKSVWVALE
ncbi:MAG: Aldehyde dehydrogenase PuuC [Candidatus Hinthialibacteria bacterium OLB16]|nr:MAG: Aldehyde dehydrogenase PuuC [Candidatus Hinthialibacteria bacterium OLB16]